MITPNEQSKKDCGEIDVSDSFNSKIKQTGIGFDNTEDGVGEIERDFLSQHKDIVHDHIYKLDVDHFKKTRMARLKYDEERKKNSFAYGNITDDRFIEYEKNLFTKDLAKKCEYYKSKGASYFGANGYDRAFSRRDRRIIQNSSVEERGTDTFKEMHKKDAIKGRHDTKIDYKEEEANGYYVLRRLDPEPPKIHKHSKGLNFDNVVEQDVRERYGLLFGRKANVDKYITRQKEKYVKNDSHNAGSRDMASGRYRGGFERRNMLNEAQNNNQSEDYEFTVGSSNRVNLEAYYYDYGNKKNADDVIVDVNTETHDEDKLDTQL